MNLELVEEIVAVIGQHPVSEILVEQEGRRVRICRPLSAAAFVPASVHSVAGAGETSANSISEDTTSVEEIAPPEMKTLSATMVGIFHHADPPLPYAAEVTVGQVVGSIESMKLMNEVLAEFGGRVIEVLTEDGAPVEYGQPLFRLALV